MEKKRIIIVHFSMELGGAETSLLGLLQSIDYKKYDVDLLLLNPEGELYPFIPHEVHILPTPKRYFDLTIKIKDVLLKGDIPIALARLLAKFKMRNDKNNGYMLKQYSHIYSMPFLPDIKGKYDLAISFIDPHYIIKNKINAPIKLGWFHTDYSKIEYDLNLEKKMWNSLDYIINVSDACKNAFDNVHKEFVNKSLVIENILSSDYLFHQALELDVQKEMEATDCVKLLSIGRFTYAKNFDNVPDICKKIINSGINVKWFIIGYGSDEELIKAKIKEQGMDNNVIILGKKTNPYPYIENCDIYVQPSRMEGKCVAVREAQILHKPVVITNYSTSTSQIISGVDGVIVPMDNEKCARGIVEFIKNKDLQTRIIEYISKHDYTNANEIEKIYRLVEE